MAVNYSTQAAFAAIDGACSFAELTAIHCRKGLPAQACFVRSTEGLPCTVGRYTVYTEIDIKIIIRVIWGWEAFIGSLKGLFQCSGLLFSRFGVVSL
jgi:hypothetical protein